MSPRIVLGQLGLGLDSKPQRAADPLHVDPEHPRSLTLAERGDGQPRQVAHRPLRAVAQRRRDLQTQRVQVDLGRELPPHLVETPRIVNFSVPQDDWSELGELRVERG